MTDVPKVYIHSSTIEHFIKKEGSSKMYDYVYCCVTGRILAYTKDVHRKLGYISPGSWYNINGLGNPMYENGGFIGAFTDGDRLSWSEATTPVDGAAFEIVVVSDDVLEDVSAIK